MRMTGKRHPYSSDFKIGLDADLKIVAYEVTFYQNAGAAADLSPAVLERTLFHATNTYFMPNVTATAYSLPHQPAAQHGLPGLRRAAGHVRDRVGHCQGGRARWACRPREIQRRNLLREGDLFPYRQPAEMCHAEQAWDTAAQRVRPGRHAGRSGAVQPDQ